MTYPSVISTFSNPLPTNRLNSPSHSSVETAQNTGLTEIQTFVGVEGPNSVAGTLVYDIRSGGSNGGGHVQTAVLGGTGQTTFTKGNILVAQSASVLSKLAVGNDGYFLSADSTKATGITWVASPSPKISTNASTISSQIALETSIMTGVTIPGSTLGTNNAIRTTVFIENWIPNSNNPVSVVARAIYGNNRVASVLFNTDISTYPVGNLAGTFQFTLLANNSSVLQKGMFEVQLMNKPNIVNVMTGSVVGIYQFATGSSSVNSSADQILGITVHGDGGSTFPIMRTAGNIVEKII